jgi:hypothetical protein
MKTLTLFVLFFSLISCRSSVEDNGKKQEVLKSQVEVQSSKKERSEFVSRVLVDISELRKIQDQNPITLFKELATVDASKVIDFSSDNIIEVLADAKAYKYCVFTTANHTLVKIIDMSDCVQSGSWGTCMPKVHGYIKKGKLIFKEDYMNNVIGRVDDQVRTAFLFN